MDEQRFQDILDTIRDDVLARFSELKKDNEILSVKIKKIEEKLGLADEQNPDAKQEQSEMIETHLNEDHEDGEPEPDIDGIQDQVECDIGSTSDISGEQTEREEEEVLETRPEVKLEKLPSSTFTGFCFRPIAGWKNSAGRMEISKETVTLSEDGIDLKILGFESDEEIVKIEIPLKDIDKVEASFEERTVLFLFVTEDICEAALQSLAMTNIASFSFVDKESMKIRICFEKIGDQCRALLREYFRRNAIYFRTLSCASNKEQIFFKPIKSPLKPKYDSNKPLPLADFVKTFKTVKFQDRVTYTCKVCDYYNPNKDSVLRHINKYHVGHTNDKDMAVKYVK